MVRIFQAAEIFLAVSAFSVAACPGSLERYTIQNQQKIPEKKGVRDMNLTAMQCPACGANLSTEDSSIEEGGKIFCMCQYCGTRILLQEDGAGEKNREKEIEPPWKADCKTDLLRRKKQRIMVQMGLGALSGILLGVGVTMEWLWLLVPGLLSLAALAGYRQWCSFQDGKVKVPYSISGASEMNYTEVEAAFLGAGFLNVTSLPMKDLTRGLFKKPEKQLGRVAAIRIEGKTVTCGGRMCDPHAHVMISYHSLADEVPGRMDIQTWRNNQ